MSLKISAEKFLTLNRPWAQAHATYGREPLDLYRDPTGKGRLTLTGWPHPKSWHKVLSVVPAPTQSRQVSSAR